MTPPPDATAPPRNAAAKALVVDDEDDFRQTVAQYLELHGYEAIEASNGLEALLHLKRQRPRHVILDLHMPRLGGLEALRRIRTFDPAINVVVVTGDADPEIQRRARDLGARAVFSKPVSLPALLQALGGSAPAVAATAVVTPHAGSPPSGEAPASQGRILIVDDDPDIRDMLQEFLGLKGYETATSADGAAAVREITRAAPDVILLDLNMPGLSGIDALPTIRALAPEVAIIMVSGTTDIETSTRALAHGAFDYVVKPVDLAYLEQSVHTAVMMKTLEM